MSKTNTKLPEEGLSTSIAPVNLKEVDSPPIDDDSCWKEVGVVKKLFIHPVKSMQGISVDVAEVGKYGLAHNNNVDRQFMIVTERDMKMITARRYPRIVLVSAFVNDSNSSIKLSAPDMPEIIVTVPTEIFEKNVVNTEVFGMACKGYDMGDGVARWLSTFILEEEKGLRLITHFMPSMKITANLIHRLFGMNRPNSQQSSRAFNSTRPAAVRALLPFCREDDVPLYADGFGFLLLAENSVNELNRRLEVQDLVVEETRFRPNIFVSGTEIPFEEDSWCYIRIGDCLFRNSALCGRCVFTTVDPKSGEKHPDGEPLKTLKTFRSTLNPAERKVMGDSPFFGINLGVDKCGTIHVGDKIFVAQPIPKAQWWTITVFPKVCRILFYSAFGAVCAIFAHERYKKLV